MEGDGGRGQPQAPCLQQAHHFGGKGGKGGEGPSKTGDGEKPPLRRQIGHQGKEGQGQTDEIRAQIVGEQGAQRDGRKKSIEGAAQKPAQHGPQGCAQADGGKGLQHGLEHGLEYGLLKSLAMMRLPGGFFGFIRWAGSARVFQKSRQTALCTAVKLYLRPCRCASSRAAAGCFPLFFRQASGMP